MLARVHSSSLFGIDAYPVEVEVDITPGLPKVVVVGLPDAAVRESKDRVKSAIKNSGFKYPQERITVNLAPADTKKEGPCFDLPIALGILVASEQMNKEGLRDYCILGELALDGRLRPIKGALSIALSLRKENRKFILPLENAAEAAVVDDIQVFGVKHLLDALGLINAAKQIPPYKLDIKETLRKSGYDLDFSEVKGQESAKRALEIAASGAHNVLMIGPPGAGKTMLSKRLPAILPDMTLEEMLETTRVHSIAGLTKDKQSLLTTRPFRAPHHTSSDIALVGGGAIPKPGEISLAHNGVLFLDELPEFHRDALEVLRQPMEEGEVVISRISKSLRFPSRFLLVATMNPCPCGYFSDSSHSKQCHCSPYQIQRYRAKISGPLLDRIDIHIEVPGLKYKQLIGNREGEPSKSIRKRVNRARKRQLKRFKKTGIYFNSRMNHRQIKKFCPIDDECRDLLRMAIDELGISARAYDKILKVSRTIADLAQDEKIRPEHISEAIQYRSLDRTLW